MHKTMNAESWKKINLDARQLYWIRLLKRLQLKKLPYMAMRIPITLLCANHISQSRKRPTIRQEKIDAERWLWPANLRFVSYGRETHIYHVTGHH